MTRLASAFVLIAALAAPRSLLAEESDVRTYTVLGGRMGYLVQYLPANSLRYVTDGGEADFELSSALLQGFYFGGVEFVAGRHEFMALAVSVAFRDGVTRTKRMVGPVVDPSIPAITHRPALATFVTGRLVGYAFRAWAADAHSVLVGASLGFYGWSGFVGKNEEGDSVSYKVGFYAPLHVEYRGLFLRAGPVCFPLFLRADYDIGTKIASLQVGTGLGAMPRW